MHVGGSAASTRELHKTTLRDCERADSRAERNVREASAEDDNDDDAGVEQSRRKMQGPESLKPGLATTGCGQEAWLVPMVDTAENVVWRRHLPL